MASRRILATLFLAALFMPMLPAVCTATSGCPMAELTGATMAMPEPCHDAVQLSDGCCCVAPAVEPPAEIQVLVPLPSLDLEPQPSTPALALAGSLPAASRIPDAPRALELLSRLQTFLI